MEVVSQALHQRAMSSDALQATPLDLVKALFATSDHGPESTLWTDALHTPAFFRYRIDLGRLTRQMGSEKLPAGGQ